MDSAFYYGGMHLFLALFVLLSEPSVEERFLAALQSDIEKGKPEQTLAFIAPSVKKALSADVLAPIYLISSAQGKVLSLKRDPSTPFVRGRPVRFVLVQERARTHIRCVFNKNDQIIGYWFRPAPQQWSMEKIRKVAKGWKGETVFFVEVNDPTWEGDVTVGEGLTGFGAFPLGSIFKIFVLGALDAARLDPERKIKIREEWKSLPSGVLHLKPAGTEISIDELATKMIAISDNTATDHLLHLLGREKCEKFAPNPKLNRPMLTTREMFLLKGGGKEAETGLTWQDLCKKWPDADRKTRLAWVEKITAPFAKKKIAEILPAIATGYRIRSTASKAHLTFEWFAAPETITSILMAHWRDQHETFLKYYGKGSSIYPRAGLQYYGFKGGSETNVMAISAMAVSKKGRAVAVCVLRRGDIGNNAAGETAQLAAALLGWGLKNKTMDPR